MFHFKCSRCILAVNLVATAVLLAPSEGFAAVDVLTSHNDLARTGQNRREIILAPNNVNASDFGKLFVAPVDGQLYAQPLIVAGLQIRGKGVHDVLYVATEHNSVYAYDANDGGLLWRTDLSLAGETPGGTQGCNDLTPELGITATPVIDRRSGPHGTIYVVAMSMDAAGNYFHRLHALDLTTGAEEFGGPKDIVATYPGTGPGSVNGILTFDPKKYTERAGLVLHNGVIYTTWGAHCDRGPYHNWIIGYDEATLAQVRLLNLTPNGSSGSIWQSGAAPAVDSDGFFYAMLANGTFETTLDVNGFPNHADFGQCFVKLSTANNALQLADYWTMFNTVSESQMDFDLGSGGPVVLPDMTDSNGNTRHLVVGSGKDGHIYLADRDNMGKYNPNSNANLYQDLPPLLPHNHQFGAPAFFNGWLYFGPWDGVGGLTSLSAFSFTNARLNSTPSSQTAPTFRYPGTTPSISSFGRVHGIVWAAERGTDHAVLHAYKASDLANELYNSDQAPNGRDQFGVGNKFFVPTIANGKVYVGTSSGGVAAFGLFNPPRLAKVSAQDQIGTGDNVLIAGFTIHGTARKRVVLRGIGPSLQVNGALQDPVLDLYRSDGMWIASNDNWATDVYASHVRAAGLAPSDWREAALARRLSPGSYTAIVRGANNTTGIGLAEVYDLSHPPMSTMANLSARGFVGTGDNVLIGGITVTGLAPQIVVFRAIGPDLAAHGVPNALADPTLELYDGHGTLIASNDNWKSDQKSQIEATGLAPGDDRDAAIYARLQPGNYTAIVRGSGGTTGIALVEAYAHQ